MTTRSHRMKTTGNLQQFMRANGEHGVDNYYKQVGASYRNPHFPGVRACMFIWLERSVRKEGIDYPNMNNGPWLQVVGSREMVYWFPLIFDMACGSGVVTVAAYEWWKRGVLGMEPRNTRITFLPLKIHTLPSIDTDGSAGELSALLKRRVPDDFLIIAADPYIKDAYTERTTLHCAPLAFRDISEGLLPPTVSSATSIGVSHASNTDSSIDKIDMVVCSFALHLVESSSELFALLRELSTKAIWLVVLAPHKRPEIKEGWGWVKWDSESWSESSMHDRKEFVQERVHCRVYRSINILEPTQEIAENGESALEGEATHK